MPLLRSLDGFTWMVIL